MTRLLFWLALAVLVLMALRSKFKAGRAPGPRPGAPARAPAVGQAEPMLCCARCGIYYPAGETVRADGHDYCSAAHASRP